MNVNLNMTDGGSKTAWLAIKEEGEACDDDNTIMHSVCFSGLFGGFTRRGGLDLQSAIREVIQEMDELERCGLQLDTESCYVLMSMQEELEKSE